MRDEDVRKVTEAKRRVLSAEESLEFEIDNKAMYEQFGCEARGYRNETYCREKLSSARYELERLIRELGENAMIIACLITKEKRE